MIGHVCMALPDFLLMKYSYFVKNFLKARNGVFPITTQQISAAVKSNRAPEQPAAACRAFYPDDAMGVTRSGRRSCLHGELLTKTAGGSAHVLVGTTAQYPVTAGRAAGGGGEGKG